MSQQLIASATAAKQAAAAKPNSQVESFGSTVPLSEPYWSVNTHTHRERWAERETGERSGLSPIGPSAQRPASPLACLPVRRYNTFASPHYNDSHCAFRAKVRAFVDAEVLPFVHEVRQISQRRAHGGWQRTMHHPGWAPSAPNHDLSGCPSRILR